jgi:uncharacterized OB-fold protein
MGAIKVNSPFVTEGGRPFLVGGRRKRDGRLVFPLPGGAEVALYDSVRLATEGRLWSYTVQRFRPKSPPYAGADEAEDFKAFAVGYIELPEQIIVEARLEIADFSKLKIGMPMRLALSTFPRVDGKFAQMYVFRPVAEED